MEKVKLPREVAEAIDGVKNHADETLLYNMQYIHDVCEQDKWDAPKFQPIHNWIMQNGHVEYFKALVNGYEVEETPEEKVRKFYDGLLKINYEAPAEAVVTTLNYLGIKIEGVNA